MGRLNAKMATFVWRRKNESKHKHNFEVFAMAASDEASALKHIKEHTLENGWMHTEHRLKHFDLEADLDWESYPEIIEFFTTPC